MVKKLVQLGNSAALIIDKSILDSIETIEENISAA